ncbi:MAG TPA: hypothetical protein VF384_06800 [Planctomycetota bacterium]
MKRLLTKLQNPLKEDRVDHLLRIVASFESAQRAVPGHVRRELVMLSAHWGKRRIPAVILDARRLLQGSGGTKPTKQTGGGMRDAGGRLGG